MKRFYLFIGLFVYLFIGSIPAKAGTLSLSLEPSIIEINAIPPANTTTNLVIKNLSENQVALKIEIKPFKAKSEKGEIEYLSAENFPMLKNIQILDSKTPVENIILGPKQEKNLTLSVNIPKDTNISDYYFSIIFISENKLIPTSTSSLNQLGIAANVLLSVGSLEDQSATLEEFSTKLFYEKGPVDFTIRIKNKGAHFIKPKADMIINNMFGQSIGHLELDPVNVLSDSIRSIPNAVWNENFILGLYTATLNVSLSQDGPSFTRSIRFLAFPFQGLIAIVMILIVMVIIINKIRTKMNK